MTSAWCPYWAVLSRPVGPAAGSFTSAFQVFDEQRVCWGAGPGPALWLVSCPRSWDPAGAPPYCCHALVSTTAGPLLALCPHDRTLQCVNLPGRRLPRRLNRRLHVMTASCPAGSSLVSEDPSPLRGQWPVQGKVRGHSGGLSWWWGGCGWLSGGRGEAGRGGSVWGPQASTPGIRPHGRGLTSPCLLHRGGRR